MQPPTLPTEYFVILSAVLFILGIVGVLVRRNAILIFMSIELMLNAANLALVAFARQWGNMGGQMTVFFCDQYCRCRGRRWFGADCGDLQDEEND